MRISTQILGSVLVIGMIVVIGCSKQQPSPEARESGTTSNVVDSKPLWTPKERALNAKDELFKRLSTELVSAMSDGGPSAAIEVCSDKAPKIAATVGEEFGVSIGRTSFKLRNPANKPPEWATPFVEQRVTTPQFLELENQALGALLPIRLKAQCLVCHGPKEQIAEDVRDRIAALYPEDSATGFQEGDLRGWFWVEVSHDASSKLSHQTPDANGA